MTDSIDSYVSAVEKVREAEIALSEAKKKRDDARAALSREDREALGISTAPNSSAVSRQSAANGTRTRMTAQQTAEVKAFLKTIPKEMTANDALAKAQAKLGDWVKL